jgi:60 kDa SS-A/Ro ribonucleoprotein
VKSLRAGEGGRRIKRVAGRWLLSTLSEYWAIKYGADRDDGYALADLVRVYHPKAGARLPLLDWLLGKPADLASLPQVAAFERLKSAPDDSARVAAITEGRLPHEVVTPFARSPAIWEALVPQLPLFALVRHLAALERHGVLDRARTLIEAKLADAGAIERSKILPYRFVESARHVAAPWAKDALRGALELAFANVPAIDGRTAVLLDRSGSMSAYVQTAAIFGVSLMKQARGNGRVLLFDDRVDELAVSMRDSVLTQAERVTARGGTDTSLPMMQLVREGDIVDNVVLITDEQQNRGMPFFDAVAEYRRRVNARVKVFIVDVAPYRNALTPPEDARSWYVYGWSDQALAFISMASRGFGTMVDAIRNGIDN